MSYFGHQPVLIVPKAKRDQVNAILERHGYGPGNLSIECSGKAQSANAPATHYALECPADNAFMAAIRLAESIPGVHLKQGGRGPRKLDEELGKKNLKKRVK